MMDEMATDPYCPWCAQPVVLGTSHRCVPAEPDIPLPLPGLPIELDLPPERRAYDRDDVPGWYRR